MSSRVFLVSQEMYNKPFFCMQLKATRKTSCILSMWNSLLSLTSQVSCLIQLPSLVACISSFLFSCYQTALKPLNWWICSQKITGRVELSYQVELLAFPFRALDFLKLKSRDKLVNTQLDKCIESWSWWVYIHFWEEVFDRCSSLVPYCASLVLK